MKYLNKFLYVLKQDSKILKSEKVNFVLGLTTSSIKDLKKCAIDNKLIKQTKNGYDLTLDGENYLISNPLCSWSNNDFPLRPNVNLEYLKEEKISRSLIKIIRNLAKNLINGEEIKIYSLEQLLVNDIENAQELMKMFSMDILSEKRVSIENIYNKYLQLGLTKSLISVFLLMILARNFKKIAIYEKSYFQLNFDTLMFDRMVAVPQNFVVQKTEMNNSKILERISLIIFNKKSNNILDITKELFLIIKKLDKYTLQTKNLSLNTIKLRNIIINAKDPITLFKYDIPKVFGEKNLENCGDEFLLEFKNALEELKASETNLIDELQNYIFKTFSAKTKDELAKRFCIVKDFIGEKELKILSNSIIDVDVCDTLWIKRVATNIHQLRVPKDWSDDDYADFKVKAKELALKFFILESITSDIKTIKSQKKPSLINNYEKLSKSEQIKFLRHVVNM